MSIKDVVALAKAREQKLISRHEFILRVCSEIILLGDNAELDTLAIIISVGADEEGEG